MSTVHPPEQVNHQTHPGDLAMSPATSEPVSNSPFLKLPAELRNRIYELAIESKPRIASLRMPRLSGQVLAFEYTVTFTAEYDMCEPALLSVCREIRREAKGIFFSRRPCKVVLFAYSFGEAEIFYWEHKVLQLFSRPETMISASARETGLPNYAMWQRAIHWLRDAQVGVFHGGTDGETEKEFEGEETSILCAVAQVPRNPSSKPWDLVGEQYSRVDRLLRDARRSLEENDWKQI